MTGVKGYLGVLLVVVLLCPDPSRGEVVPDGVGQSEVVVSRSGHIPVFDQSVVEVAVKSLLHVGHILHLGDPPHGDLLPFVQVALRGGHGAGEGGGVLLSPSGALHWPGSRRRGLLPCLPHGHLKVTHSACVHPSIYPRPV